MITVSIDVGKGPREVTVDTSKITLGFIEDVEEAEITKKKTPIFRAFGDLCGLTREERRALTAAQFNEIANVVNSAIAAAQESPKDSG